MNLATLRPVESIEMHSLTRRAKSLEMPGLHSGALDQIDLQIQWIFNHLSEKSKIMVIAKGSTRCKLILNEKTRNQVSIYESEN